LVKLSEKISFHPAGLVAGMGMPLGSADVREEHGLDWLLDGCGEVIGLAATADVVLARNGREIAPTAKRPAKRDVRV
jgi:hypothetical protein